MAAVLPAVCFSSAAGAALWSKVDLSAFTDLGILRMQLSTTSDDHGLRLDQFKLAVNGKPVRIPKGVDLRVRDPQLNAVRVITTRSISCIEDECPDPRGWPISVDLLYGENVVAKVGESECGYSLLHVDIEADGISGITKWDCIDGRQEEHVMYSRDGTGDH